MAPRGIESSNVNVFQEQSPTKEQLHSEEFEGNAIAAFIRHSYRSDPKSIFRPLGRDKQKLESWIAHNKGKWTGESRRAWDRLTDEEKLDEGVGLFHEEGLAHWAKEIRNFHERIQNRVDTGIVLPDSLRRGRGEVTDETLSTAISGYIKNFSDNLDKYRNFLHTIDEAEFNSFEALSRFMVDPNTEDLKKSEDLFGKVTEIWIKARAELLKKESTGVELIRMLMERENPTDKASKENHPPPVIGQGKPITYVGKKIGKLVIDLYDYHARDFDKSAYTLDEQERGYLEEEILMDEAGISELSEEGVIRAQEVVGENVVKTFENMPDGAIGIVLSSDKGRAKDLAEIIWREMVAKQPHPEYLKIAAEIEARGSRYGLWFEMVMDSLQSEFLKAYEVMIRNLDGGIPTERDLKVRLNEAIHSKELLDLSGEEYDAVFRKKFPEFDVIRFFSEATVFNILEHLRQNLLENKVALFNKDLPRPHKPEKGKRDIYDGVVSTIKQKIVPELKSGSIEERKNLKIINSRSYIIVNMDLWETQAYEGIIQKALDDGDISDIDLNGREKNKEDGTPAISKKKILFIGRQIVPDTGFQGLNREMYIQLCTDEDSEFKIDPGDPTELIDMKRLMEWASNPIRTFMVNGEPKKMRVQDAVKLPPEKIVYGYLETIKKLPWRIMHSEILAGRPIYMPITGHSAELDFLAALLSHSYNEHDDQIDFEKTAEELKDSMGRKTIGATEQFMVRLTPEGQIIARFRGRERVWDDIRDIFKVFAKYAWEVERRRYFILPNNVYSGNKEDEYSRIARLNVLDSCDERFDEEAATPGITVDELDNFRKLMYRRKGRELLSETQTVRNEYGQVKSRRLGLDRSRYSRQLRAENITNEQRILYQHFRGMNLVNQLTLRFAKELDKDFVDKSVEQLAESILNIATELLIVERRKIVRDYIQASENETPEMWRRRLREFITKARSYLPTARFKAGSLRPENLSRAFSDGMGKVMRNLDEMNPTSLMKLDEELFTQVAAVFYNPNLSQVEQGKYLPDTVYNDMLWKVREALTRERHRNGIDPRALAQEIITAMHSATHDADSIFEGENQLDLVLEQMLAHQRRYV